MKLVLLLAAVFILWWLLRGAARRGTRPPRAAAPPPAPPSQPQPMLTCAFCGVHLPRDEALPGRGGVFCDAAHRAAYEAAHPES